MEDIDHTQRPFFIIRLYDEKTDKIGRQKVIFKYIMSQASDIFTESLFREVTLFHDLQSILIDFFIHIEYAEWFLIQYLLCFTGVLLCSFLVGCIPVHFCSLTVAWLHFISSITCNRFICVASRDVLYESRREVKGM